MPDADSITLSYIDKVKEARTEYNALSPASKAVIGSMALRDEEAKLAAAEAKISYKKLRKKTRKLARRKVLKVSRNVGEVTYTKVKGSKKIRIDKETGKVTVGKGLKKGKYKIKVKVKARGDANHKAMTRAVTFTIRDWTRSLSLKNMTTMK